MYGGTDDGLLEPAPKAFLSPRTRRVILCLTLLVWGLWSMMTALVVVPGCDYSEVIDTCGDGSGGQNAATEMVSMTSCTSEENEFGSILQQMLGAAQAGFGTNLANPSSCQLYGCATHQCLKATTPCNSILPTTTYKCVGGRDVVDIQPFPMIVALAMLTSAIVLFFAKRPMDPTNARLAGIIMIVFVWYHLGNNITIVKSCPWGDQTYSQCDMSLPGKPVVNQTQVVSLTDCNAMPGYSPFATNLPRVGSPGDGAASCQLYNCGAKQCLKTTRSCVTDEVTYECVGGQGTATVQPVLLFFDMILIVGALYFFWKPNTPIDWRRVVGLVLIVVAFHYAGQATVFIKACDNSAPTVCGSGTQGQVNNPSVASMIPCYQPVAGATPSPFSSNLKPVDMCLQRECGTNHCLKQTQTCSHGFPSGAVTTECVLQRGTGVAAPVALMFYFVMVGLGIFLYVRGGSELRSSASQFP